MSKNLFILLLVTICALPAGFAQQLHNPFSIYGMGEFQDTDPTAVISNGWANQTFYDRFHVNTGNAASYPYLLSTSFEVGLNAKYDMLNNGTDNYKYWSGQLAHMSLAFPVFSSYNELLEKRDRKVHWGMGIAVQPYSQVAYNYQFDVSDPQAGLVRNKHFGNGGTYKLVYNNGISYKDFSFGLGLHYIFGKIIRSDQIEFLDNSGAFGNITSKENEVYVKGLQFNFSAMYNYILNPMTDGKKTDYDKQKRITLGASFQPMSKLKTRVDAVDYVYSRQLGTAISDTLSYLESNQEYKGKYNSSYGVGLSYQHGAKWQVNINYDGAIFDQYAVKGLEADYRNTGMFKIGAEWCPEPNSFNSFLKRSKYRLGFRTGTMPLALGGEQTKVTAGVIGYGFPVYVNRQISHVNIAFEGGQKTYSANFKEKYFNIRLGFNLNDDYWFLKRKFD